MGEKRGGGKIALDLRISFCCVLWHTHTHTHTHTHNEITLAPGRHGPLDWPGAAWDKWKEKLPWKPISSWVFFFFLSFFLGGGGGGLNTNLVHVLCKAPTHWSQLHQHSPPPQLTPLPLPNPWFMMRQSHYGKVPAQTWSRLASCAFTGTEALISSMKHLHNLLGVHYYYYY